MFFSFVRRHPFLSTLIVVALLSASALAYALATFDLNHYRGELQSRLSMALERPVRLGKAELTLRRGPAVLFHDVEIGKRGEKSSLQAERLLGRLDWRTLLKGRIAFSRIVLERPRIYLLLEKGEEDPPDLKDLETAEIRSLTVREGVLEIEDRRRPERPLSLRLEEIEAKVSGISPGRTAKIHVSGQVRTRKILSPFTLAGSVALPSSLEKSARAALGFKLERFPPAPFLSQLLGEDSPLSGVGTLEARLDGAPDSGMRIQARFAGSDLKGRIPGRKAPVPLREAKGSAFWTVTSAGETFRDLSFQLDELTLAGEVAVLSQGDDPRVEARFETPSLPLRPLLRLLPQGILPAEVTAGSFQVRSLRYSGLVSSLKDPLRWGENLQGEVVLAGVAATLEGGEKIADAAAVLRLKDDILLIEGGKASVAGVKAVFEGGVTAPFSSTPELTLGAEGILPAGSLLARIPAERRRDVTLTGNVPAHLGVEGKQGLLRFDLRADLTPAAVRWNDQFEKGAGRPAHLSLSGELSPARIVLENASLRLPPLELRARGSQDRRPAGRFDLTLDLDVVDLVAARSLAPALAEVRAEGGASARLTLSGEGKRIRREGNVTLRNAGFHIIPELADIRQANGVLHLKDEVLEGKRLSARLGSSPVTVDGRLSDFKDPRIDLRVRAKAIRANELIFTSPTALLRDVEGTLIIDRRHVGFSSVRVRLDGGTEAVVRGEVRDFDRPLVLLDVVAQRADIDEVIALWDEPPSKVGSSPSEEDEVDVRVRVTAHAAQGDIGPLAFRHAEGVVSWESGRLSVYPLTFQAGGGRGSGRVVYEDAPGGKDLLTVSGHVDSMDAASIYRELLQRKGLVTGELRGDFFLAGDPEDFLQTVQGGVSLVVEKGVLRKFNSLAKVFSILNVSQIFTLKLPDMARDGMPFDRLSGTFTLNGGTLRTEDLFVDSNAMNFSLVGNIDLKTEKLDLLMGLKPLRTVDKIVTRIPLAGWLLTGDEKALITAHFRIRGTAEDPDVNAVPITSLSEKAVGIFRRLLGLPGHVAENVGEMVRGK